VDDFFKIVDKIVYLL